MILTLGRTSSAQAAFEIIKKTQYYTVEGTTREEVRRQMRKKAPGNGGPHAGFTEWNIRWNFNTTPSPDGCRASEPAIRVEIVRHLPKWVNAPDPGASDIGRDWNRFLVALSAHEDGHVKIGSETAREVETAMRETASAHDCRRLKSALESAARKAIAAGRQRDTRFDQETRHGMSEGCVF